MVPSSSFVLVIIGFSCILIQADGQDFPETPPMNCREDQEFNACGSHCAPTCSNYSPNGVCDKMCVPGCYCKQGFLPDDSGSSCIEEEKCKSCRGNTAYSLCATACPKTCNQQVPPRFCTTPCKSGCACKEGYVFLDDKDGSSCVLPQDCPPSTT